MKLRQILNEIQNRLIESVYSTIAASTDRRSILDKVHNNPKLKKLISHGCTSHNGRIIVFEGDSLKKLIGGYCFYFGVRHDRASDNLSDPNSRIRLINKILLNAGMTVIDTPETKPNNPITYIYFLPNEYVSNTPIQSNDSNSKKSVPMNLPWKSVTGETPQNLNLDEYKYKGKTIYADWSDDIIGYVDQVVFSIDNFDRSGGYDFNIDAIQVSGPNAQKYKKLLYKWVLSEGGDEDERRHF